MYKVYDYYEDEFFIGSANTYAEACYLADEFYEDTDGECDVRIFNCEEVEDYELDDWYDWMDNGRAWSPR